MTFESINNDCTISIGWNPVLNTFGILLEKARIIENRINEQEYKDTEPMDIVDIRLSLGGDPDAYRRLVETHQQAIGKIMWRFSRDYLVHQELVQDVFVEAFISLATYKGRAPFIHWLRKIATRIGFRYWKLQARQRQNEHFTLQEWDQIAHEPSDNIEPGAAAEMVHKLLSQLPPRDRLVLTLRYLEGCDVAQTAHRTGWSKGMVKVQTLRAKRKLAKLLPKQQVRFENE